jgi:hypothetical protein
MYDRYGDGEFLSGPLGFETISVAGLTVPHQEFGLVKNAAVSLHLLIRAAMQG